MIKASDDKIFRDINAYSNITERKPEDIGYEFSQATNFFLGQRSENILPFKKDRLIKLSLVALAALKAQIFVISIYMKNQN